MTDKTHYEFDWQDPVAGRSIRIGISHARDYLLKGQDHLGIESLKPARAPLPFTETGFRSHFMPALELINAGGPAAFVKAWLYAEARTPAWGKQQAARRQGDLFQWADAKQETSKRKSGARVKPPTTKPPAVKPQAAKRPAAKRPAQKPKRKSRVRSIAPG